MQKTIINPEKKTHQTKTLYTEISEITGEEAFRDNIGTLDERGKRRWIYPKKSSGRFTRYRNYVSWILLAFLFSGPFLTINGHPLLLLNILERKFVILGQPFWPQDFYLFVLVMLSLIVFIIVFTVAFGRIFCGWVCPQTIFMEFVFRRIERWIEGDAPAQRALDQQPWNTEKIIKKTAKQILFIGFSFLVGNTFLAYLIGKDAVLKLVTESPLNHITAFSSMVLFTGLFYLVFSRLREQVCIVACPYGRLQGVLLDNRSIVIAYDFVRGEPRGKLRKGEERTIGDCIDCKQCIQVCPTGIDIRNGTQLECINCTACIDACDEIMTKIQKPTGLIRYASHNEIEKKEKTLQKRLVFYSAVLLGLIAIFLTTVFNRSSFELTILRAPGTLYSRQNDGTITNIYEYQLVNKTMEHHKLKLRVNKPNVKINLLGEANQTQTINAKPQEIVTGMVVVSIPSSALTGLKTELNVEVYKDNELVEHKKTNFTGPN